LREKISEECDEVEIVRAGFVLCDSGLKADANRRITFSPTSSEAACRLFVKA
jgi:hypothetical protein